MSTPSHPESVPLNDTDEAKELAPDPQLLEVARLEKEGRARGLSEDEAQALAWAEVNARFGSDSGKPAS
ncbi:MAG: hypothetical protein V4505_12955 [Pseudomonadota bacterium]